MNILHRVVLQNGYDNGRERGMRSDRVLGESLEEIALSLNRG